MSEYQVIARKWRPQRFADVVGQQHVVRTLRNAITKNRTGHAYLFVGPRGIGKTTLARIFAKALNCLAPVDGEPCCQCENCRAMAEERSLDVIEIDAASRNNAESMRELADDVLPSPVGGKYKIYIIDEVHMLSKVAWNVLLKTVEEPPAHVKFIFATTEVHQVLPTIISRCQRFDLQPIPTKLIAERLALIAKTENVAVEPEAVGAIARAAEGGMRDAQSLLDQMIAFFLHGDGGAITGEQVLSLFGLTDTGELDNLVSSMLRNEPAGVITIVAKLARKGKNLETLFEELLGALRAVELCALLPQPELVLDETPENIASYRQLGTQAPNSDVIRILLEHLAPAGRVLRDALDRQIVLETLILKAMREAHAVRIDDILRRLNQLRSAGELKFLEKLPVVDAPLPVPGALKAAPAAVIAPAVPERVVEAAPQAAPAAEKVEEIPAPCAKEEEPPAVENIPPQEEKAVVETAVEAVAEEAAPRIEEPVVEPAPEVVSERAVAECVPEEKSLPQAEESETVFSGAGNVSQDNIAGGDDLQQAPDRKMRHSVLADNPDALRRIAYEDPKVAEVIELFNGTVIDMHVM